MREPAQSFEDLIVWQRAHEFVLAVYRATKECPPEEKYGLTSQLRRAAMSVAANIAEGFKKRGKPDKVRLLTIAYGSLEECRHDLILSRDLDYLRSREVLEMLEEAGRLLGSYTLSMRKSI